jgi:peptidoglycan/xylan/chitin deacetylase (PgdA/CDA1 family)
MSCGRGVMNFIHFMNLNKVFAIPLIFFCMTLSFCPKTYADKISDYEFEKGEGHLYVGNRSATKCIAITFDDGPHPVYTPKILEILEKYDAKATFFMIGQNVKKYENLVKEVHLKGHEIGNHTYTHPDLRKISASGFLDEIEETKILIEKITGTAPKLFRPPGGYLNNDIVNILESQQGIPVLWSWRQDTRDWECPDSDSIVESVIRNLKDGDIILFHDFNAKNSPTPAALEKILSDLSGKGYKFVTVSELMSM